MKYKLVSVLTALILLLSFAPFSVMASAPEGFEQVATDESLVLYANKTNGNFALENKTDGSIWYSSPPDASKDAKAKGIAKAKLMSLCNVTLIDMVLKKEAVYASQTCVQDKAVSYSTIENGYSVTFNFKKDVSLTIEVALVNGKLSVKAPLSKIKETNELTIGNIQLMQYFGAGGLTDEGFLFVPDGSGAIAQFNNGKLGVFEEPVYGLDKSTMYETMALVKQPIRLPVFGISKNGKSVISVIKQGDTVANIRAQMSNIDSSYNSVCSNYKVRNSDIQLIAATVEQRIYETDRVLKTDIEVEIIPVSAGATYYDMADEFRNYLENHYDVKPSESIKDSVLLNLYGAVEKQKKLFGIPLYKQAFPLTTYKQAQQMVDDFKSKGINDLAINYNQWEDNQVFGKINTNLKPSSGLGGKSGFQKFVEACKDNNISLFAETETASFYKSGNGYSVKTSSIRALTQEPSAQYSYFITTYKANGNLPIRYFLKPQLSANALVNIAKPAEKLGLEGISLGTLGSVVYSNYYKKDSVSSEEMKTILKQALKDTPVKQMMATGGLLYTLPFVSFINDAPVKSSGFRIFDYDIPFYQIALSGLRSYSTTPVNLQGNTREMLLKAVETGSTIKYSLIYSKAEDLKGTELEFLCGGDYSKLKDSLLDETLKFAPAVKKIVGSKIINHEKLADNVFKTTFENGINVIVNYADAPFDYEGSTVEASNFIMIGGTK